MEEEGFKERRRCEIDRERSVRVRLGREREIGLIMKGGNGQIKREVG